MQSKAQTISKYVSGLAPGERSVIEALDKMVRSEAPKALGSMKYGMPTYELASRIVAFNAQKNYFSFYADPEIVGRHRKDLRGTDCGKSCIRFRKLEDLTLDILRRIVRDSAQ